MNIVGRDKENIYLMPFTAQAVLAYHALVRLRYKVVGFFDNAQQLDGKNYCGVPIQKPCNTGDKQSLIVLCDSRYSNENRTQMELLGYLEFSEIEHIVSQPDVKQAIKDVDIESFYDLVPNQCKLMREANDLFRYKKPDCLLTNGNFAVSIAQLAVYNDSCAPQCCLFENKSEYEAIINFINERKNNGFYAIAVFAPYPYGLGVLNGYYKAILAADELFSDNCVRIYFEQSTEGDYCIGAKASKNENLVRIRYTTTNPIHISTVGCIIDLCSLVYVHSIYRYAERILSRVTKPIILDVHGVVPEEEEYRGNLQLAQKLTQREEAAFKACSLFLCRNEPMKDYYISKYGTAKDKMLKLPSFSEFSLPASDIQFNQTVTEDQTSIVYSGSIDKWQMIPMMIDGISRRQEYHYIIASADTDEFDKYTEKLDTHDIEILFVEPQMLESLYRRAQFGFILREDIIVNRVACPTKLVEYCTFGVVPIMLSNKIGDFDTYGLQFVHYNDFLAGRLPDENGRREIAKKNYDVARKMSKEYKRCKKELKSFVTSIATRSC